MKTYDIAIVGAGMRLTIWFVPTIFRKVAQDRLACINALSIWWFIRHKRC